VSVYSYTTIRSASTTFVVEIDLKVV
jgi:hypothetical protein